MSDFEQTPFTKEEGIMAGRLFIWAIIIALIVGVMAIVTYSFYPALLGIEREAFVQSHQYVEARHSAIFTYYDEYSGLSTQIAQLKGDTTNDHTTVITAMESQQSAILMQIRNEARKLPEGEVPAEITNLLNPNSN